MKSELLALVEADYYPALFTKAGAIALFDDDDSGTIVVGNEQYSLGDSSLALNVKHWQRLPSGSQVILTQD